MEKRARRFRNLLFTFVFMCALFTVAAFGTKASKDVQKHNMNKGRTTIEVKDPEYKPIHYEPKPIKYEMKLIIN
jgi:hypothetical protein